MALVIECAYCGGSGEHPRKHKICPICRGKGCLIINYDNPVKCRYCDGSGEHLKKQEVCRFCQGTGVVPRIKTE